MANDDSKPDALATAISRFGQPNQENSQFRPFPPTSTPIPPSMALRPADSLWFNQKDIVLDGWRFTSCRFDKCRLFLNSQHFELVNCFIDNESVIYYQNHTINIIKLFNSRFSPNPFLHPHFNAFKNNDGTISIVR